MKVFEKHFSLREKVLKEDTCIAVQQKCVSKLMMLPLRKLHLLYRSVQLPLYAMMLPLSLSQHIILH